MDLFSFVKQNVDILNLVLEYTNLKKAGAIYWKGRCPFHHEKTGSFTVSPHKQIFYCFGCHVTGDVINFIEKIEHLTAFEATQFLVQRYNLELPKELAQQQHNSVNTKIYYQACYTFASWCHDTLMQNPAAQAYLQHRKITQTTIAHFLIGVCAHGPRAVQNLIAYAHKQGINATDLMNAHILLQSKQGLYLAYDNRIIFPIKDHIGQICGFGGRIFMDQDTRVKYYNSMESAQFKKSKILFGLDSAKHEIQKQQTVIIVEGYMDCIALWQLGVKNAVATLGTACTTEHLQQLTKHAQTIYLLYDADNAGKNAIARIAASCWQLDFDIKVITLPEGHDPASMMEQNINIQPYVNKAQDIFNFFVDLKGHNFNQESIKHKMMLLQELFEIIRQHTDSLKQNILLMKASESLQIPLEILKNEYTNKYYTKQAAISSQQNHTSVTTPNSLLEDQIVAAIAYNNQIISPQYELLLTTGLSGVALQAVQSIIQHVKDHQAETCNHTIDDMVPALIIEYVRNCMFKLHEDVTSIMFDKLMQQFQKKYWKSIIMAIKTKMIQANKEHNKDEIQRLLQIFEQLKFEVYKNGRL